MNVSITKIVAAVLAVGLLGIGLWIQHQGDAWVGRWYLQEKIPHLNALAGVDREASLDFYAGRITERVWGPLSQVMFGTAFLLLALTFLKRSSGWVFALAVWGLLILTKWDVLFYPPYGDAIGGPFAEAIWLKRHHFNYALLFQQPTYDLGGPKVYMFSIYPTVMAFLMSVFPSVKSFLIAAHGLGFGLAAGLVALTRSMLRRCVSEEISLIAACLLLSLPLFQSQAEAINMEIPCAFFLGLGAWACVERRFGWGAAAVIAAMAVKGTAVFAAGAWAMMAAAAWMRAWGPTSQEDRWPLTTGAVMLSVLAGLKVYSKFWIKDQHVSQGMVKLGAGWPSLSVALIFYLFLFGFLYLILRAIFIKEETEKPSSSVEDGAATRVVVTVLSFGMMWFGLFMNFFAVSPRYRVLVYPFLVMTLTVAFTRLIRAPRVIMIGGIGAVILAQAFSFGLAYPPMEENDHVILERSLEYRNDLLLQRKIARRIESRYAPYLIGAPFIVAQYLALPELGYVTTPLNVMIYGFNATYGDIKPFPGVRELDISRTVYVGLKVAQVHGALPYPVHPVHDRVLETLEVGNKKATIFMGGASINSLMRATNMIKLRDIFDRLQKGGGR